jgi:hypothetical protein
MINFPIWNQTTRLQGCHPLFGYACESRYAWEDPGARVGEAWTVHEPLVTCIFPSSCGYADRTMYS